MVDELTSALGTLTTVLTALAAYLQWKSHLKQQKIDSLELRLSDKEDATNKKINYLELEVAESNNQKKVFKAEIDDLRHFISGVHYDTSTDHHVVVLGPRTVGKTSLVTNLTSIWKDIRTLQPTPVFTKFEYKFPDARIFPTGQKFKDIGLAVHDYAKLVIWDYGGEDHLLADALKRITELKGKCVLVLVLTSERDRVRFNNEYFSFSFLQTVSAALMSVPTSEIKVFVLFSKWDLASAGDGTLQKQKELNANSLHNIQSLFGSSVSFHGVSAAKGTGVTSFMQELARCAVDEKGLPKAKES